jgi:hypothetical protein
VAQQEIEIGEETARFRRHARLGHWRNTFDDDPAASQLAYSLGGNILYQQADITCEPDAAQRGDERIEPVHRQRRAGTQYQVLQAVHAALMVIESKGRSLHPSLQFRTARFLVGDATAVEPPLAHGAQQRTNARPLRFAQRQHVTAFQRKYRAGHGSEACAKRCPFGRSPAGEPGAIDQHLPRLIRQQPAKRSIVVSRIR